MNQRTLELVKLLLENEPPSKDRTEMLKFHLLPRNTPVKAMIDLSDDEIDNTQDLGPIHRPTAEDIEKKNNPVAEQEKQEIAKSLKGRV